MSCDPVIQVDHLTFRYADAAQNAVDDLSVDFFEGQFVAVLGHNGSGKSTLAKHTNAILLPSGGTVTVLGMDTADASVLYQIRQRVGMVFQNPDNQLVATVVEEDVAFAPENLGIPTPEIRIRVDEALQAVGMSEFAHHAPHMLSGGQKQRIAIAGCLAMHPKCIVLDEPTAMLDPRGRKEVLATIKRLNREEHTTVILITHFMDEAAQADRVIVMDEGKLLLDGKPQEVFSHVTLLKEVGLDVPQTTELLEELRAAGYTLPRGVIEEEQCVTVLLQLLEDAHQ